VNGRYCWCCSVSDENQQDRRTSLDNSEVHFAAAKLKSSKVSRLSAPLPGSSVSAKAAVKKVTGQTKTPTNAVDAEEGSGKRAVAGRACDKASCVRAGLKPRCFVGATQR